MKSDRELRDEVRRIRERVRTLSGFWIGEGSAAIYALEWALGKRPDPPSEDIGRPRGGREQIAASLVKAAEKAPRAAPKKAPPSAPRGRREGRTRKRAGA